MLKSLFKNAMGATHGQVPARFPVDVERNHWNLDSLVRSVCP